MQAGQYLLRDGIHVRAQLAERHAAILRHHPRAVQVPQALVRVRLHAARRSQPKAMFILSITACASPNLSQGVHFPA